MSSLEEEFLLMLLASHVRLDDITRILSGLLEDTSVYASRQLGTRAASFGVSLPAILTGGLAENASVLMAPIIPQELPEAADGTASTQGQAHRGHPARAVRRISLAFPETDTTGTSLRQLVQQSSGTAHTGKEQRCVDDGWVVHRFVRRSRVRIRISSSSYGVDGGLEAALPLQASRCPPMWAAMPVGDRQMAYQ